MPTTRNAPFVRKATEDDVSAAAALATAHDGGEVARWEERLARSLAAPDAVVAVAEVSGPQGGVVAYGKASRCHPVDDDAPAGLYLTGLVVDPTWRRRGLGEPFTGGVGVLVRCSPAGAP